MVSDDTHDKTIHLLEQNDYFGLNKDHIDIVKQENVPAIIDDAGNVAMSDKEFKILTKPYGHGEIHSQLYSKGVAKKWLGLDKRWMLFI